MKNTSKFLLILPVLLGFLCAACGDERNGAAARTSAQDLADCIKDHGGNQKAADYCFGLLE